ncbi:MAG TPA: DUF1788 domain-containing protein [Firmicutes bacterium]|nr:DUF1788 domain-containing protein [Bacillota bacterium]
MSSLDKVFDELLERILEPDVLNPARSDPVFYFVYPPEQMLEVKRSLPRWMARIRQEGLGIVRLSLARVLWELIYKSGRWEAWLELEKEAEIDQINEAVRDVLRQENSLVKRVTSVIESTPEKTVVFITEAELLHPYFRTRIIESHLHDKVPVPTVIFYPGRRSGQYGLRFLNFYSEDGNYRSTLMGET